MEKDYNLLNTTPVSPILKQTTNSKNSSRSCTRGSFEMFFLGGQACTYFSADIIPSAGSSLPVQQCIVSVCKVGQVLSFP